MIRAATSSDFPLVQELILDGARSSGFDPALTQPTTETQNFFAGLLKVIEDKIWLRPMTNQPLMLGIPASLWMYENPDLGLEPLGFVALKSAGRFGQELWLAAIRPELRGRGVGKQMITELLAAPAGRTIAVVQCDKHALGGQRMAGIMSRAGFELVRDGKGSQWLASRALAEPMKRWLMSAS
jgi:ribosomal protein S18 acetylase RimI-like enzyme